MIAEHIHRTSPTEPLSGDDSNPHAHGATQPPACCNQPGPEREKARPLLARWRCSEMLAVPHWRPRHFAQLGKAFCVRLQPQIDVNELADDGKQGNQRHQYPNFTRPVQRTPVLDLLQITLKIKSTIWKFILDNNPWRMIVWVLIGPLARKRWCPRSAFAAFRKVSHSSCLRAPQT